MGLKVTPDGQHLYVCANVEDDAPLGGLHGFTIHADGSLTPTADSPAPVWAPRRSRSQDK